CGTSSKDVGVQLLLDGIIEYLPSPLDVPAVTGIDSATGEKCSRQSSDGEPLAALAFKIAREPHVGHITYLRVYSGIIRKNSKIFNSTTGKRDRVTRILRMHANRREELDELSSGCIGAVVGLKSVGTGDTITTEAEPIVLEKINFAEPVISVAIEPESRGDYEKMSTALHDLAKEDPTFRTEVNPDVHQTIISGMGELHLEIITDRLRREFGVAAKIGKPKVAFKETVGRMVEVEGSYVKQSGGSGHFGKVELRVEPLPPGEGFEFDNAVRGGEIPREYIGSVKKGVEDALKAGVLGGYPVIDLKVTLLGGAFHEVDSNDMAFKIAASIGTKNGLKKAGPILKEPIMKVEIVVPEEYVGGVMQEISSRRGRLAEMENRYGDIRALCAYVPLSEMFGYSTVLRNCTQGRGDFTMEFHCYEQVPQSVSEEMFKKGA
ncbi:MAG: EF-Tu/IF-2/RF-3 family GTPase, partial [bacterium]